MAILLKILMKNPFFWENYDFGVWLSGSVSRRSVRGSKILKMNIELLLGPWYHWLVDTEVPDFYETPLKPQSS